MMGLRSDSLSVSFFISEIAQIRNGNTDEKNTYNVLLD